MNPINRRTFLKSSALSVPVATGAAGLLSSTAAQAAAEKPAPSAGGKTYQLTREIPVEEGYDLVVAGGGPAGAAAAICAARLGAKVLLVEGTGCMGGMGTNALVSNWYCLGDGRQITVGGLIVELITRLCRDNQVSPAAYENFTKGKYLGAVGFDPEALKILFDKLCIEAGVEVRFFTRVIDADANPQQGRVRGVITSSVEGYRFIGAKTFSDATGDAVLSELCGAKSRAAGRDTPHIMPPTLCAAIADIRKKSLSRR